MLTFYGGEFPWPRVLGDAVENSQKGFSETQQVGEAVEAEVDEVPRQLHHLWEDADSNVETDVLSPFQQNSRLRLTQGNALRNTRRYSCTSQHTLQRRTLDTTPSKV